MKTNKKLIQVPAIALGVVTAALLAGCDSRDTDYTTPSTPPRAETPGVYDSAREQAKEVAESAKQKAEEATAEAKQKIDEAATEVKESFAAVKDRFVAEASHRLEQLDAGITQAAQKASELPEASRETADKALTELREQRAEADTLLQEVKDSTAEVWVSVKSGFELALKRMEDACQRIKESLG
jgi:signal transduction histidine kinase